MSRTPNLTQADPNKITTMRVSVATLTRLLKFGSLGETYEQIVNKILDMVESKQDQGAINEQSSQGSKL